MTTDQIQRVEIPMALPSASNLREKWIVKANRVKAQRALVAAALATHFVRPELPVRVRLVRVSARPLDDDNLRGAFKAVRDEIAKWAGVDDRDERIVFAYGQARTARKKFQAADVTVEPLGPEDHSARHAAQH